MRWGYSLIALLLVSSTARATEYWQDDQDANGNKLLGVCSNGQVCYSDPVTGAVTSSPLWVFDPVAVQWGMGSGTDPNATVIISKSVNGYSTLYLPNPNAGTDAGTAVVLQTGAGPYGTPPYTNFAQFGVNRVPLATEPYWTGGSATLTHSAGSNSYPFVFDIGSLGGAPPWLWVGRDLSGTQYVQMQLDYPGNLYLPATMSGAGASCVQVDAGGKFSRAGSACGSGSGTVTSVSGTAGRIVVTPSSPNPVVDLATFGSSPSCTYASVVIDAYGRTTCTSGATPQPAGSYITSLTHDVVAAGPGAAAAEVIGITDGSSVDWQVSGPFANGKALGFVAGSLAAVSFQTPLTACTDYVSTACQTGATDISGTNATTVVVGIEHDAAMRGALLATNIAAPSTPGAGTSAVYVDSTSKNIAVKNDAGTVNHGVQSTTCGASTWVTKYNDNGVATCTQPSFSDLSGGATCAQLPAFTGDVTKSAGSCVTAVVGLTDGSGADWPTLGTWSNSDALVLAAGKLTAVNECLVNAGCTAGGDLAGTYQNPTIPSKGKSLVSATDPTLDYLDTKFESTGGSIVVSHISGPPEFVNLNVLPSTVFTVQLSYSMQWLSVLNPGELVQGGITPNPTGPIGMTQTEYPIGLAAGTVKLSCNLITNRITSGTYTFAVSHNGSDTGATLSYNSGSTPGVIASTTTVGSPGTADTWGLDASTVGTAVGCGSGLCPLDIVCTILLQP